MMNLFRYDDTMLKFYKKMLRNQGWVVLVCIFLLIFNGYGFINHFSTISGVGFGAFICNTIWGLLFYCDSYSDYQLEKHRYRLMKELEDKHHLEKNIEFLKEKQKQYDSMISELKASREHTNRML